MRKAALSRGLTIAVGILMCAYVLIAASVYFGQRHFLYQNHGAAQKTYTSPAQAGEQAVFRELPVQTQDGLNLKAWYAPARSQDLTLVFFHGNGDRVPHDTPIAAPYVQQGYGFLLCEYQGYGGQPGEPSEQGLYADARGCVDALKAAGVDEQHQVFYGHSLGTGVAVQVATEYRPAGVMLLAPFVSITRMMQMQLPILPMDLLSRDRFDSLRKIPNVVSPLLLGHGERDHVIPFAQGQQLFAAATQRKEFLPLPKADHNDAFADFSGYAMPWLAGLGQR